MASDILSPFVSLLPRSRVLHVKCELLPKDKVISADIGEHWRIDIFGATTTTKRYMSSLCQALGLYKWVS
jgi:hypothetical protein